MRIGILSDTHGSYDDFMKALGMMGQVDCYIHLGDVLYHGPREMTCLENTTPGVWLSRLKIWTIFILSKAIAILRLMRWSQTKTSTKII